MASAAVSISCPACKKSFKGKADLDGKKIRCPSCDKPFVVKLGAAVKEEKPAKAKAGTKAAAKEPPVESVKAETPPPPAPPPQNNDLPEEDEENPNPYGVSTLDLAPRCPNCANEMESAEAVICLHCGYNTQTRTIGETKSTYQTTLGHRLQWLAPGLASAAGLVLGAIICLYYCLVLPFNVEGTWWSWITHESLRLWMVCGGLFMMWPMGFYAFRRLILEPTPPEIVKE